MKVIAIVLGAVAAGFAVTAALYAAAPFIAVGAIIYGLYLCSSDEPEKA